MLRCEAIHYKGWQNCYRLFNQTIELVVVADIGPRIIRFGYIEGANQFFEDQETLGMVGGDAWRLYGGHRLWHAPEALPRTYYPDNQPVQARFESDRLTLTQELEETTRIKKEMTISLDPGDSRVEVVHRLYNLNLWPVEVSPWALSVMAPGGRAIVPLPPRRTHAGNILPTGSIAIWPYTNMADPRWYWGNQYVFLDQDSSNPISQKAGFYVTAGWLAYQRGNQLFLKLFDHYPDAQYPDRNSNVELFTNHQFTELETLGRQITLPPGGHTSHKETWVLKKDIDPIRTEEHAEKIEKEILA